VEIVLSSVPPSSPRRGGRALARARHSQLIVDESGRSLNHPAAAALQVADVIVEDFERGISEEPIELGRSNVDGLLAYAFPSTDNADVHAQMARSDGLAALYLALRRFHGDVDRTP
jgi:hypothetical protein